jgi:hypothetical protein
LKFDAISEKVDQIVFKTAALVAANWQAATDEIVVAGLCLFGFQLRILF